MHSNYVYTLMYMDITRGKDGFLIWAPIVSIHARNKVEKR